MIMSILGGTICCVGPGKSKVGSHEQFRATGGGGKKRICLTPSTILLLASHNNYRQSHGTNIKHGLKNCDG